MPEYANQSIYNRRRFQTQPAEGQRMQYHLFPQAQRGGMAVYPFSGVLEGCKISNVSLTEADSVAAGDPPNSYVQFDLSSGDIKLDGRQIHVQEFSGSSDGVLIPLPSEFDDLSLDYTGDTNYDLVLPVFINPRRVSPAFETGNLPSPGGYSEGDIVFEVAANADYQEHYMVRNIYRHDGSDWVLYNNDITFESPVDGQDWGHNNLPFNDIKETDFKPGDGDILTGSDSSSFTSGTPGDIMARLPEKKIYHTTNRPPRLSSPGSAYLRESAALFLAEITINVNILSGSFDSVNSVSVDQRYNRTRIVI